MRPRSLALVGFNQCPVYHDMCTWSDLSHCEVKAAPTTNIYMYRIVVFG